MGFKNQNKWVMDLVTLLPPFLLITSEVTGNSLLFVLAMIVLLFMIKQPFNIFPSYFIASLSSTYFSPIAGLGAGRVISILLIVSLLLNSTMVNAVGRTKYTGVLCIVLIIYNFFSSSLSLSGNFFTFYVMLQNLLVLFLIQRQNNVNIEKLSQMLFWSSAIVMAGIAIQAMYSGVTFDTTERYSTEYTNGNNFAMMCAQLGAVFIAFFILQKNISFKLISLMFLVISIVIIFLSGSRSSLIGLLTTIIVLPLISSEGLSLKKIFLVAIIVAPIYVLYNYAMESDLYLLRRFTYESVTISGGSGRSELIAQILTEVLPNYFLFGVGIGGANIMAAGIAKPCHNIIIDPLSQLGIVGFVLYWSMIIPILITSFRRIKMDKIILLPLALFVVALINGIGETVFYEKFFWNSISLCLVFSQAIVNRKNYEQI